METVELNHIEQALTRLDQGSYGECADCGEDVPFERLKLEPHTLRCVDCESRRERFQPRAPSL
jgi:DnaK suppressor protein